MSTKARVICGVALVTLGYTPVVFDFLHENAPTHLPMLSNNFNVFESKSVPAFEYINPLAIDNTLSNRFMYRDVTVPVIAEETDTVVSEKQVKKVVINPLRNVNRGRYAGSQLVKSKITLNFYTDARRLGVPTFVVDRVIHTLSSKIDFRRALRKGSEFEIIFNKQDGMLYSKISTRRETAAVYAMRKNGKLKYFFEDGSAVRGKLSNNVFGQPLRGQLSISSHFGMRKHPIFKKYKFHSGVDFRARHGTPVFAIYDGVVTRASTFGGYGKCVDVKHPSGYVSRYAHLSGYNVKVGDKVRQGNVIAYVGSSGNSTGSHLHLELSRYNKCLNPLSVKMIPESSEKGNCDKRELGMLKKYVEGEMKRVSSI